MQNLQNAVTLVHQETYEPKATSKRVLTQDLYHVGERWSLENIPTLLEVVEMRYVL